MKTNGTNINATATKPCSDTAQPMPQRFSVTSTHNGNVAAVILKMSSVTRDVRTFDKSCWRRYVRSVSMLNADARAHCGCGELLVSVKQVAERGISTSLTMNPAGGL